MSRTHAGRNEFKAEYTRQVCECEHEDHFRGEDNSPPKLHPYSTSFPSSGMIPLATTFGTFRVCQYCRHNCLAPFIEEGGNGETN